MLPPVDVMTDNGVPAAVNALGYAKWKTVDGPQAQQDAGLLESRDRLQGARVSGDNWRREVRDMVAALDQDFDVKLTPECDGPWTPRSIVEAIAYFDQAITERVPAERKHTRWAVADIFPSENTLLRIIDAEIGATTSMAHMFFGGERNLSWSFAKVADEGGTVDFHTPPGVKQAEHAASAWAEFSSSGPSRRP
ncbi:hypothetical protein JDV02_008981 [Purpureocillium takamizusanense]|uniref:Uncharacterized protein n=1 Tax=Purpureocillium takamizusanense TaxID=2060973 RepID=A0A9Q8QP04_9HYPO|nr:uncharacterized protein JDV02_008981 [Purpureocillium takamizusanense]UNI23145.1 hypothetical protein JDV02_008981 [Purpureocillium takamizusanense]